MKNISVFALAIGLLLSSTAAAEGPGQGFPFSFTQPGDDIPDDSVGVYPLFMDNPRIPEITSLELDITGLSHPDPWDLDIYLIDPFGNSLEIMTDRGDRDPIDNIDLTFSDKATGLPPENSEIMPGTYLPEGPGGFAQYVGGSGGTDAWILLVIDDAPPDIGEFDSFTLRGTYVPEPATLSLLALGALAVLRRRRR